MRSSNFISISRWNGFSVLLLVLVAGCDMGGAADALNRKADREIYNELVAIQKDFRKLRADGASPQKWQLFEAKVIRQTQPMLDDLNQRAKASRKATQKLLFAIRDYLPRMLENSRTAPDEYEQQFDSHLDAAKTLLGI